MESSFGRLTEERQKLRFKGYPASLRGGPGAYTMPERLRSKIKVLILGSDDSFSERISDLLADKSMQSTNISQVADLKLALEHLEAHTPELIFATLETHEVIEAIKNIRKSNAEVPILALGHKGQETLAVEAVKAGAQDCIFFESLADKNLFQTIQYAIERRRIASDIDQVHRDQLKAIIESVSDGVMIVSSDSKVLFANPAAERILNKPAAELIEKEPPVPFDLGKKISHTLNDTYLEISTSVLPWGEEKVGYCVTLHDVTDHKALQDRLARTSTLKDEFIAHMSHELRTPMNGIVGMASLLEESGLNETQKDFVKTIKTSSDSMLDMIGDLLDLSKIEAGRLHIEKTTFNLKSLIEDTLDLFRREVQEKGILLTSIYPPNVPEYIQSDSSRLRQIIVNLLSNAIRHTDEGSVLVRVQLRDDRVSVTVEDSGIGIPGDLQNLLFKPFTQLSSSPDKRQGGTGLGLVICKKLANLLDGNIELDQSGPGGSSFSIDLPSFSGPIQISEKQAPESICYIGIDRLLTTTLKEIFTSHGFSFTHHQKIEDCNGSSSANLIVLDSLHSDAQTNLLELRKRFANTPILLLTKSDLQSDSNLTEIGCSTLTRNPLKQSDLLKFAGELIEGDRSGASFKEVEEDRQIRIAHNYSDEQIEGRVLVAEDNVTNQKVIASMLEKIGLRVDTVTNGSEAVQACRSIDYDCVLMDCRMPVLGGFGATKSIRTLSDHYEQIPIIAVTAEAIKDNKQKCQAAGMDGCLIKPIDLNILREALHSKLVDHSSEFFSDNQKEDPNLLLIDENVLETLIRVGKKCGNNLLEEVVDIFKKEFPEILQELESKISKGHSEDIENLAHKLKGSARNIGAKRLAGKCHRIEEAAESVSENVTFKAEIIEINECYTEVCSFLETYLEQAKSSKAG